MTVCDDSACLVLSYCVVGCGMAGGLVACLSSLQPSSSFSLASLSLLSVFVGVRGSARAALRARTLSPNTIASSAHCSSSLLSAPLFFSSLSLSAFLVIVEWRWVIHHVLECCVGMTAMGSLSRSSPFFW